MKGIIGKKIGMTSIFNSAGKNIPCTVIEAGPCMVTQVKTNDKEGYSALQLGFDERKEKNTPKPLKGHFDKVKTTPKKKLIEFINFDGDKRLGDKITVDIFQEGDIINVIGNTKGKGFQGVVKRHGFHGVGGSTHGQHNRQRSPGSIGMSSTPSRVFKGMKMAGRMGNKTNTTKNLEIIKVLADKNMLIVSGAVPGYNGSYLIIQK